MHRTLPATYYTDPQRFRDELERFYFASWICAGRAAAISNPGDYFLRDVAGESVIVTRDRSSNVRAFYNVCRHRGTRLCTEPEGSFEGRIRCPYHGWTYSTDGRLLGAPHMTDPAFSKDDFPLCELRAELWDGHIFLNFASDAPSLSDQLGRLPTKFAHWHMGDLRLYKRILYDVKANWKLLILNFNECLHCPLVHPALNRLTDYLGADNEPPTCNYVGGAMGFRDGAETMSLDGKRRRDYLPGLTPAERGMVCYYAIYPNFLLSLHPDYMMVHTLWPVAVDRTQIICEWHFHPSEMAKSDFYADDAVEFWDITNREDWRIVELSQLGIQSRGYIPGPYTAREELLHAFDTEVLRREAAAGDPRLTRRTPP
jgi:Rieske 2Fe-2S family protein